MRVLKVLVGELLKALPEGKYYMIEWSGFDIFIYSFFDEISMKRSRYVNHLRANGCFLLPKELIKWLKNFKMESSVELRVIRDEDGDSVIKCAVSHGKAINVFRSPASDRISIEWEKKPLASVDWTTDMNTVVKCMDGPVHVDMHHVIKFACGFASAVVEMPVSGEAVSVYSSRCLSKIDIEGEMCVHASKLMEVKSKSVLYLIAPML